MLGIDGDLAACQAASRADAAPPEQCGALLRLEMVALVGEVGEGRPAGMFGGAPGGAGCPRGQVVAIAWGVRARGGSPGEHRDAGAAI